MSDNTYTAAAAAPRKGLAHTLSEEIALTQLYPQLWLHLRAGADGVHLTAVIIPDGDHRHDGNKVLYRAVWQPEGVTEQLLVEWAYRALRKALQDHYEGTGHI